MSSDKYFFTGFSGLFEPFKNEKALRPIGSVIVKARVMDIVMNNKHPKYVSDASIGMVQYKDLEAVDNTTAGTDKIITKWAIPINKTFKKYPLIGEVIGIVQGPAPFSYIIPGISFAYYFSTFDIFGSHNYNPLPIYNRKANASSSLNPKDVVVLKPGKTFQPGDYKGLLPFEGDIIIEGRNGSAIRFGSTDKLNPDNPWSNSILSQQGDPIVVITTNNATTGSLRVEDINKDGSSIYICHNQNVPVILSCVVDGKVLLDSWDSNIEGTEVITAENDGKIIDSNTDSSQ